MHTEPRPSFPKRNPSHPLRRSYWGLAAVALAAPLLSTPPALADQSISQREAAQQLTSTIHSLKVETRVEWFGYSKKDLAPLTKILGARQLVGAENIDYAPRCGWRIVQVSVDCWGTATVQFSPTQHDYNECPA